MNDETEARRDAVAGQVERPVRPVAWADDAAAQGHFGNCASAAAKAYWERSNWVDKASAAKLKHPLYALTEDEVRILNKAKSDAAWRARRLDLCKCDRIEYCRHCFPPEFREGGVWHRA